MTKNQKLLLGVGVLGAAGYLIWKQNQKPAVAASFAGKRNFLSLAAPRKQCKCSIGVPGVVNGKTVYECCGDGIYALAPGKIVQDCSNCLTGTTTTSTTLQQQQFAGRQF